MPVKKNDKNKFILIAVVILVCTSSAFGATKIKVGVHESKPLSFTTEDNTIAGIYPEVIQEVARLAKWDIEWVNVSWLDGLKMAQSGQIDLLGPIAYSKERLQKFRFNNEAVIVDWGQVYLPKNSKVQSILDLDGKKVAFQKGHIMYKTLEEMMKRFDITCLKVPASDQKKVFEMVEKGEADAGVVNRLFGLLNEKNYDIQTSPIIYAPLELRFAAPKTGDRQILQQLDVMLKRIKQDKDSAYPHILDKYLLGKPDAGWHATIKQVLIIIGIGLAVVMVMVVWTISLKFQVRARTKELAASTEELKNTNRLLNAVMENTTDAIFIKDLTGKYILANSSTCKALGKPHEQVIGKTDAQLFPSESADIINDVDTKVLRTAKAILAEEKLDTAYGETYWLANKSPYLDETHEVIGLIGISRNITDLKQVQLDKDKLQDQLRQTHKMEAIGTLAGGIAHDFNNIMGIIIGNIELALDFISPGHPSHNNIMEIKTASLRARDVVRQLLSFSRKTKKEKKPVHVHSIVDESIKLLRASIPTTIDIRLHLSDNTKTIEADSTQIHQVIINLCTNAAQAMEATGGVLSIRLSNVFRAFDQKDLDTQKEYVQLTISDTGIGIDPEIKDRVFDPYFTTKEIGQGTGIGLSVVRGIVDNHDGYISIYSEPEKGTTVKVLFPTIEPTGITEDQTAPDLRRGSETILLVDDEDSLVKLGKQMLEKQGYEVIGYTDPEQALNAFMLNPQTFDLLISDMTMPKMTGEQLAESVLNIRPDIPIIISTGFSDRIKNRNPHKAGVKGFLEKPFDSRLISEAAREALDN